MAEQEQNSFRETGPNRFVGRQPELARLIGGVEDALRGHERRFGVIGPAGIGKTRLLREIERYATWRGLRISQNEEPVGPGPRLILLDPYDPDARSILVRSWTESPSAGVCVIAASRSAAALGPAGVSAEDTITLRPLDEDETVALLRVLSPALSGGDSAR